MQINISGKNMELTEAIKDYVEKKISSLEKFYDKIVRAEVSVGKETNHHSSGYIFVAECRLYIPGKDVFASKNEKTLYKAVDKIRDYLEGELKKHKAKREEKTSSERVQVRESKGYQDEE